MEVDWTGQKVRTDGLNINYVRAGRGKTVIFCLAGLKESVRRPKELAKGCSGSRAELPFDRIDIAEHP